MKLEDKVKEYFGEYWPGTETPEQCNTTMSFTPLVIMRLAEYFYNLGKYDTKNVKEIQKYWYLQGVNDKEQGNPMQFIPDEEDQVYNPVHLSVEDFEAIRKGDYENGKNDMIEELSKCTIHCKVSKQDSLKFNDTLEKIDAHPGDRVRLIILKD